MIEIWTWCKFCMTRTEHQLGEGLMRCKICGTITDKGGADVTNERRSAFGDNGEKSTGGNPTSDTKAVL